MATTITPNVSETGEYLGADVHFHRELHHGMVDPYGQDFVETNHGHQHIMQDVEIQEEQSGAFDMDSYADSLNAAYPDLASAIEWAAEGNMAPDFILAFNAAVENQDLNSVNRHIEYLLGQYDPSDIPQQEETSDVEDPAEEIDQEQINSTLDSLYEASYDSAQVETMESLYTSYSEDSPEAMILGLGVAIGRGEITARDAVGYAMSNHNIISLSRAYRALEAQLNPTY